MFEATLKRLFVCGTILTLALAPAACGDDGSGPAGELSRAEVKAMLEALIVVGTFDVRGVGDVVPSPPADGPAGVPVAVSIDATVSCPEGGTLETVGDLSGELDPATGAGDLALNMTQTHADCAGTAPSSGMTFTFDGAPELVSAVQVILHPEGGSTQVGSNVGTIAWETEGRTGTCLIDLSFESETSGAGVTGTIEGTVCELEVQQSI